jgi:fucose permease
MLVLSIAMFFLYTGTEAATGFLAATLLVSRGVSTATAGLLTSLYWGALTVGRFATGAVAQVLSPARAVTAGVVGALVGVVLFVAGGGLVSTVGLMLLGLSLAPIFPSQVALTPSRVGAARATRAIGLQLAAASLGVTCIPWLISTVAQEHGVELIGPGLVVAATALFGGHLVTATMAGEITRRRRSTTR